MIPAQPVPLSSPPRKRVMFVAALVVAALLLALTEVALRLALPASDFLTPQLLEHPQLGLVIRPHQQGHDAQGFRNAAVAPTDIVAVGDSFTYGYNASRGGSWPGQLETLLGKPVYNAGLGGFGPLQYLHVTENVLPALKPKLEVVALYTGNDIMDAYNLTQVRPHWFSWRQSKRTEGALTQLDREGQRDFDTAQAQRFMGPLRDWLAEHSMSYSVLRATVLTPLASAAAARKATPRPPEDFMPWTDTRHPAVSTVFSARLRLMSMDPAIAEVEEGFQISSRAFEAIQRSARAQGHPLLFVTIPTKELVYCKALKAAGTPLPAAHEQLCKVEPQVIQRLTDMLHKQGLRVVDTTAALEAAVAQGQQLYQRNDDGHPVAEGYKVIAKVIAQAVATP